jgi:hypothetical protein
MIIEVQMGMVDRGAELEWLSQYPAERVGVLRALVSDARFGMRLTRLHI